MKVVMLCGNYLDSSRGGVESHIYYLARNLSRLGHDVRVVRLGGQAGIHAPPSDVPFTWIPGRSRVNVRRRGLAAQFSYRLRTNLRESRYLQERLEAEIGSADVIHQHDLIENARTAIGAARRFDATLFWTNHLGEFLVLNRHAAGRMVLHRLVDHFDGAVAPSEELATVPRMGERMTYCPNGVDTEAFTPVSADRQREIKRLLGWPEDRRTVLVPRRWAPTKGILEAAHALALTDPNLPLHFEFIGNRHVYPEYATRVEQALSTIPYPMSHTDAVDPRRMVEYYQAADYTLIPSLLEATSLSALEAMACGSAVVCTDTGGLPELVADGQTGWLCTAGDPASLAAAIERATSASLASIDGITTRAREIVVERYGWSTIAMRTVDLYEQAATRRASS